MDQEKGANDELRTIQEKRQNISLFVFLAISQVILLAVVLRGSYNRNHPPCCDMIADIYDLVGEVVKSLEETNRNITKVQKEINNLWIENEKLSAEIATENMSVSSFYALLREDINPNYMLYNESVLFDQVAVDVRGNYNPNTGKFTADLSGVYSFNWAIETTWGNYIFSELLHDKVVVGNTLTGDSVNNSVASGSVVLSLKKGDSVWVRVQQYSPGALVKAPMTSFSGFRISIR